MLEISQSRERADSLDVMRGVLAIWVMIAHVVPWSVYYVGAGAAPEWLLRATAIVQDTFQIAAETHPAVLMFIVLSGYCIHRAGLRRGSADLTDYAIRRIFRIYPVYLLAIAAGILFWFASSAITLDPSREIAGTTSIEPMCIAAKVTGIVTVWPELHRCAFLGNAPLNTVMTEIWLYAAYPLILIGVGFRLGALRMMGFVVAVWLIGTLAVWLDPGLRHWWNSASLPGFLIYWWIGAAALDPSIGRMLQRWLPAFVLIFTCLSVVAWLDVDRSILVAEGRKVMLALCTAVAIRALDRPTKIWTPATIVGRAGYSIYAFHAPVTTLVLVAGGSWWMAIAAGLAAGLVAWRLYELPWMEFGRRLSRSRREFKPQTLSPLTGDV